MRKLSLPIGYSLLNFFILQWFFIRITKIASKEIVHDFGDKEIDCIGTELSYPEPVIMYSIWFELQGFTLPLYDYIFFIDARCFLKWRKTIGKTYSKISLYNE